MERVLLLEFEEDFPRVGTRPIRKTLAEAKLSWIPGVTFTDRPWKTLKALEHHNWLDKSVYELRELAQTIKQALNVPQAVEWEPVNPPPPDEESVRQHPWYCVLFIRVTVGGILLTKLADSKAHRKERVDRWARWENVHVPLLKQFDQGCEHLDVQLAKLYAAGLGPSLYPDTLTMVSQPRFIRIQLRALPSEMLPATVAPLDQTIEQEAGILRSLSENMDSRTTMCRLMQRLGPRVVHWIYPLTIRGPVMLRSHALYCAVILRLDACLRLREQGDHVPLRVQEAAFVYQLSFLDLLLCCRRHQRWDDRFLLTKLPETDMTPFELYYPHTDRAFQWGDLPNVLPVLVRDIMLGTNEQKTIRGGLSAIIQKCMPHACQQRGLDGRLVKEIKKSPALERLWGSLAWCMLAGLYPGSENRPQGHQLLLLRQICTEKGLSRLSSMLLVSNSRDQTKCQVGGTSCPLIAAAFRLWLSRVAERNPQYQQAFPQLDWGALQASATSIASLVRQKTFQHHPLPGRDLLFNAREAMTHYVKNAKAKVHRFRKRSFSGQLRRNLAKHLFVATRKDWKLSVHIKERMLNFVIQSQDPYSTESLTWIQQCAGTRISTIHAIQRYLHHVATCGPPRVGNRLLREAFTQFDFEVLTWYWYCVERLEDYVRAPLPAGVVEKIDRAMKTRRYMLIPGEEHLPTHAYQVYVLLCCGNVSAELGRGPGHDMVRAEYHLSGQVICQDSAKPSSKHDKDVESDPKKQAAARKRADKADFFRIPCNQQQALPIDLCGHMLVQNRSNGRSDIKRYMHCPQCGAFHRILSAGWTLGEYMCDQCLSEDVRKSIALWCAYCGKPVKPSQSKPIRELTVFRPAKGQDPVNPNWDPRLNPEGLSERLIFCEKHWKAGRRPAQYQDKHSLWNAVSTRTTERTIEYAIRYG